MGCVPDDKRPACFCVGLGLLILGISVGCIFAGQGQLEFLGLAIPGGLPTIGGIWMMLLTNKSETVPQDPAIVTDSLPETVPQEPAVVTDSLPETVPQEDRPRAVTQVVAAPSWHEYCQQMDNKGWAEVDNTMPESDVAQRLSTSSNGSPERKPIRNRRKYSGKNWKAKQGKGGVYYQENQAGGQTTEVLGLARGDENTLGNNYIPKKMHDNADKRGNAGELRFTYEDKVKWQRKNNTYNGQKWPTPECNRIQ